MLRLVDDYLIITTSRAAAEAVLGRLLGGFPEYNITCNPDKTQVWGGECWGGRRGGRVSGLGGFPEYTITCNPDTTQVGVGWGLRGEAGAGV